MRKLNEICGDLKELLSEHFATVRVSSLQLQEQLLSEIANINREKLPGVIIVLEGSGFAGENTVREHRITLVLVDRFRAAADDRAMSVFAAYETLLGLFTASGLQLNGVFYLPRECYPATADKEYACLALTLAVSQGGED